MNKTLLVFLLFFQISIAQKSSGMAIYKIVFPNSEQNIQVGPYKNEFNAIEKQAEQLKFELIFDQTCASFSLVEDLPIDRNDFSTKMAISIFRGDQAYFVRWDSGYYIEKKRFLDKNFRIKKSIDDMNWKLTKEKREILGYDCYKALGSRYILDKEFKKVKHDIIAWYCPEIPYNYGPFEAVGLPGMVLRLDLKGHSIVVDSIDWEKKVKVENRIKGDIVSQKEFDSIFERMIKIRLSN